MKIGYGDQTVGMLSVIFSAFLAPNLEAVSTGLMQTNKGAFFLMFLTVHHFYLIFFLLTFHLIYY
jgi:hypothetical protein